jgi:hypothetical protein
MGVLQKEKLKDILEGLEIGDLAWDVFRFSKK